MKNRRKQEKYQKKIFVKKISCKKACICYNADRAVLKLLTLVSAFLFRFFLTMQKRSLVILFVGKYLGCKYTLYYPGCEESASAARLPVNEENQ